MYLCQDCNLRETENPCETCAHCQNEREAYRKRREDAEQLCRRQGRFQVSDNMVHDHPRELMQLMAHMVIVRAEFRYDTRTVEYVAISELFEPLPMGCAAPMYDIQITKHDVGPLTFKAFRICAAEPPINLITIKA